jgi:hypothetical protein
MTDPSEGNMPRKEYDPISRIPSPEAVRGRLSQTLALARKLRILLKVAERLRLADTAADRENVGTHPQNQETTSR